MKMTYLGTCTRALRLRGRICQAGRDQHLMEYHFHHLVDVSAHPNSATSLEDKAFEEI
jgi:hypothetical protein